MSISITIIDNSTNEILYYSNEMNKYKEIQKKYIQEQIDHFIASELENKLKQEHEDYILSQKIQQAPNMQKHVHNKTININRNIHYRRNPIRNMNFTRN